MASIFSPPSRILPSPDFTPRFPLNHPRIPAPLHFKSARQNLPQKSRIGVCFAVADSDSPKSLDGDGDILALLQDLAECFDLSSDYLAKLPSDLRLDLNDAAFDLANGPVMDECGQELGKLLLNWSRAWEKADTSTSNSIARQLPSLQSSLNDNVKSAFGKRLISAGRRFQSMGQYGQGELQKIADAMLKTGKVLSRASVIKNDETPKEESRMLKFGELQVELTREKAYIGAAIGVVFGFISWELSQGIQGMPEGSLQYANDNALLLAKSLRGTLLVLGYSSAVLSAFTAVGLLLLARGLKSERKE